MKRLSIALAIFMIAAGTFAFTTHEKAKPKFTEQWYTYSPGAGGEGNPSNYTFSPGEPGCTTGNQLCAVQTSIGADGKLIVPVTDVNKRKMHN